MIVIETGEYVTVISLVENMDATFYGGIKCCYFMVFPKNTMTLSGSNAG